MRARVLAGASMAAGVALAGGGCTLLVSFDDVPVRDAGAADSARITPTATATATTTAPPPPPPPDASPTDPCDRTLDLSRVKGCDTFVANAQVCADHPAFAPYPFTSTRERDVVTCNKPDAICVEHCPTACAHLPAGFPDDCDRCAGKPDGEYCGSEMGWDARSYGLLVRCSAGRVAGTPTACAVGCITGAGGTARCGS